MADIRAIRFPDNVLLGIDQVSADILVARGDWEPVPPKPEVTSGSSRSVGRRKPTRPKSDA